MRSGQGAHYEMSYDRRTRAWIVGEQGRAALSKYRE